MVQHGVRYSGMPAWVAIERHDEIWAMVAFLEALPEMTPEEYRRLAFGPGGARQPSSGLIGIDAINTGGPAPPMQEALADCARCHGMDGRGRDNDAFPILAGQSEAYLRETLLAFSHGTRHSGMMQPPAARADDAVLGEIAGHYARQPRPPVAAPAEPALLAEGERIARQGIPAEGVPACLSCHGGAALARNPSYPALHGQHASYLENQLVQWQAGTRGGGPYRALMQTIAGRLTPEQNKAVAAWFAAQDAARD
ncbi:c-type cytochrome [Teichococcus aestuarii]|uniref:c-type cytochrome n=1 Tax=Teichococcus aestuarii TaxID=568898 RepID=UPI003623D38C